MEVDFRPNSGHKDSSSWQRRAVEVESGNGAPEEMRRVDPLECESQAVEREALANLTEYLVQQTAAGQARLERKRSSSRRKSSLLGRLKSFSSSSASSGSSTARSGSGSGLFSWWRSRSTLTEGSTNSVADSFPSRAFWDREENRKLLCDWLSEPDEYVSSGVGSKGFRKALAKYFMRYVLTDIEFEDDQLELFCFIVDCLIQREFTKEINSVMTDSSGAVLFITTYLESQHSECHAIMSTFLQNVFSEWEEGRESSSTNEESDVRNLVLVLLERLPALRIPNGARVINEQIRQHAPKDRRWKMVGMFFILRYLQPCLVETAYSQWRDEAVAVSRILQQLANGSRFQNQDGDVYNGFLQENYEKMAHALDSLCSTSLNQV